MMTNYIIRFPQALSRKTVLVLMALCLYIAAPLYDLPLLGLSFSAPLIFLLLYQVLRHYGGLQLKLFGIFPVLLALVWSSQLLSLAVNEIFGDQQPELDVGLIMLLRYAFWFLTSCLSAQLFLHDDLPHRAAKVFGYGCILLAATVLAEFFVLGGIRNSGELAIATLSQNENGWQFSAFVPFVIYLLITAPSRKKLMILAGCLAVLVAVVINASRSSWGTVTFGLILYILFSTLTSHRIISWMKSVFVFATVVILAVGCVTLLPDRILSRAMTRAVTVEDINRDKSWQIRQLMIQKGQKLLEENPFFGVGPGQFRYSETELVIPEVLTYASQDYFNAKSSHNSYIQLFAEGGGVVAVSFGFFILWLTIKGFQATLKLARIGETWTIPIYVSFICFSVHFWSVAGITTTAPWFLYGLLVAVVIRARYCFT